MSYDKSPIDIYHLSHNSKLSIHFFFCNNEIANVSYLHVKKHIKPGASFFRWEEK
jgi:hypothetical protein